MINLHLKLKILQTTLNFTEVLIHPKCKTNYFSHKLMIKLVILKTEKIYTKEV